MSSVKLLRYSSPLKVASTALQEVQLLASSLKQNPCLPWERITHAYNKAAARQDLPQRKTPSLCGMLRCHLPLMRCSRALGLSSAAKVDQLQEVLQATATNDAGLSMLAQHAKHVQRLCKSADISIFEALRVLPKAIGSEEWVEVLDQQCVIEDTVRFWQKGFRQKFQKHATMAQARQHVCRCVHVLPCVYIISVGLLRVACPQTAWRPDVWLVVLGHLLCTLCLHSLLLDGLVE